MEAPLKVPASPFPSRRPPTPSLSFAVLVFVALAVASACGGGSSSPSAPAGMPTPAPPIGATITIAARSVSPKQVQINVGQSVAFVNQDSVAHEMASDPHPVHTDCPPLNQVGGIAPGQTRQSGALTVARTCGYHDHGDPGNANMQGTVVVR